MSQGTEPDYQGPPVPDEEDLYRAVPAPNLWVEVENRPSSALFDEPIFSVDIASKTTPATVASRFKSVLCLAQFNCGSARKLEFEARDEKDEQFPENEAHAHVYFLNYVSRSKKGRKAKARKLAEICVKIDL